MGEARHNILVKSAQMQRMNHHFQDEQLLDAVSLSHARSIEQLQSLQQAMYQIE